MSRRYLLPLLPVLTACGGSNSSSGDGQGLFTAHSSGQYQQITVKDPQQSAAFLAVDDLDGDGIKEIVLTTLVEQTPPGPPTFLSRGALRIFRTSGGVEGPWEEQVVIGTTDLDGDAFLNAPHIFDIDEDGQKDILVQSGFLTTLGGSQFWLKGPDFTERSYFATETTRWMTGYYWHEAVQTDLDGDGMLDIVTTSTQSQDLIGNPGNPIGSPDGNEKLRVEWHRHLGNGQFEYHVIRENLGGVFIKTHDVDNDGDQDILLTHFFRVPELPSVMWLEQTEAPSSANAYSGVWQEHVIDTTIGLGYHMEIVDLNHDGKLDLVVGSHNHQDDQRYLDPQGNGVPGGVYRFDIPANPHQATSWPKHVIVEQLEVTLAGSPASQGVPGIFNVGDIDGDGRLDIAVPSDGSDKLWAFRQRADGGFVQDVIEDDKKMIAMVVVADIDGDGSNEIIAAQHNSADGGTSLPPGFLKIYRFLPN